MTNRFEFRRGSLRITSLLLFILSLQAALAAPLEMFPTVTSDNLAVQDRVPELTRAFGVMTIRGRDGKTEVDPKALLVTADRIKRTLFRILGLSLRGGDSIQFILSPSPLGGDEMRVRQALFNEGWLYEVTVPERMSESKMVRGVVQVLLLEVANRGSRFKSAEIPEWLAEGFALSVLSSIGPVILVDRPGEVGSGPSFKRLVVGQELVDFAFAPSTSLMPRGFGVRDPLLDARDFLRHEQPLTLNELRSAALRHGDALDQKRFQVCSQLLVVGLLNLPDGRPRLVRMLRTLPQSWNWELTFYDTYRTYFPLPLDVEKWWWVNLTAFIGRDPAQILSVESGLDKLEQILKPAVKVWGATNALPNRENITIQQLLADWDFSVQRPVLEKTVAELEFLRPNCTAALAPVVEDYRRLLQSYIRNRVEAVENRGARNRPVLLPQLVVRDVFAELDRLYLQRERLRREAETKQARAGLGD